MASTFFSAHTATRAQALSLSQKLLCQHQRSTNRRISLSKFPVICVVFQRYTRRIELRAIPPARAMENAVASSSSNDDVAVVIVDHGSKRSEANSMLEDFAELYRFPWSLQ
jgi:carbamoylphosphate synthase small subunit